MILKISLLIIAINFVRVLGRTCKLPSGETGFCRVKDDCFGSSQSTDCPDGLLCCHTSGKSIKKCKEYGKYVYSESYSEALSVRSLIHQVSECGIEATPLVVGGIMGNKKEFPHMAAIGFGKSIQNAYWLCGGSLISENFVLTAAHCTKSDGWGPAKFVRIGVINIKKREENHAQDLEIEKIIAHPKYRPPSIYYDIALCKLSSPVKMNGFVRPACLHTTYDEFSLGKGIASGWGKIDFYAKGGSDDLLKVSLSFINHSTCSSFLSSSKGDSFLSKGIIPSQICAGELSGGKDTCQGDSGGPLQIVSKDFYCMYEIVGITSFGKFCGFKNSPAVYTRISYFVPWIESIVWP